MNQPLKEVKIRIYDKLALEISHLRNEQEGSDYDACQFELNGVKIISRSAKITPKKVGQFVTCWKRNPYGITEPYHETDPFDCYVIQVTANNRLGQFVFPKSALINHGIVSTASKEGKRGFRVYPQWDTAVNRQAIKTQTWQLDYFYEIGEMTDLEKVKELYTRK